TVAVVSDDPDGAFAAFAAEFTPVEAAGGVVVNDCGEWLMIHRNGRWDLPKGHLESGERIEECAAREVEEETGVAAEVVRPLCETLHAYYFPKTARWELKRTHWYELHTPGCSGLTPQTEEGIDAAAWCTPGEAAARAGDCYPTVRTVLDRLRTSADVK
ncbi:NUDIX domain-containing protein, partial [Alistipes sp.]